MSNSAVKLGFLLLFTAVVVNANVFRFYLQPPAVASVTQLVQGKIDRIEQGSVLISSVTLVEDGGYYIIVDSPSATDLTSKEQMLKGLMSRNLVPGQVQMIITTHGHPDHFGQGNFFPNARHFFASYEYTGTTFIRTELYNAEVMKLTKNTELWNTPGHTSQDVSLIVRNTKCCGTVAVVGDLFYSDSDAIDSKEWDLDAWDQVTGHQNRRRIICTADWIVPGHSKMFKVTNEMRERSKCDVLIAEQGRNSNNRTLDVATTTQYQLSTKTSFAYGKHYPVDNSILNDNAVPTSARMVAKNSAIRSSEAFSANSAINAVEDNSGPQSIQSDDSAFTLQQLPPNIHDNSRATVSEILDMLPVTSAQDITQFRGIGNEATTSVKQPLPSVTNTIDKALSEASSNNAAGLVGSVIYPTQLTMLKTTSLSNAKHFEKLYNWPTANNNGTTSATLAQKSKGIMPVLEHAANQIVSLFNDTSNFSSPSSRSYLKIIQKAFDKLLTIPEKPSR